MSLIYGFRLPPGPNAPAYAALAEQLGYDVVVSPEVPAFGHDIWVNLARIAVQTSHIRIGPAVLIPSYRHAVAQASAIATLEALAPGRVLAGFGTGFTGRAGMGQRPLTWAFMKQYVQQVRALLHGEPVEIEGAMAQLMASPGWLPDRPIRTPLLIAAQGPRGRAVAHEVADGLISLGRPEPGFDPCLVSVNGTVFDAGETADSPRVRAAVAPLIAVIYHNVYATDPERVRALPNGDAWLDSVMKVPQPVRHLSVHRGHNLDITNGHDDLVDPARADERTFSGPPEALRERISELQAKGATGIIFGTSGADVERELRAFAMVAGLKPR